MQCYESDVKKPIRGLLQGELARTLLIQVWGTPGGWLMQLQGGELGGGERK
jgi:hypothetical protein